MKRSVSIVFFVAALLATSFVAPAQDRPADRPPANEKPLVVEPAKPKPAVRPATGPILNRFSFIQAKRLGFHSAGIRAAVEKLKADGVIVDGETSSTEAAVAVFDQIRSERESIEIPDALRDLFIAFIESMLKSLFDWPLPF